MCRAIKKGASPRRLSAAPTTLFFWQRDGAHTTGAHTQHKADQNSSAHCLTAPAVFFVRGRKRKGLFLCVAAAGGALCCVSAQRLKPSVQGEGESGGVGRQTKAAPGDKREKRQPLLLSCSGTVGRGVQPALDESGAHTPWWLGETHEKRQ